MIGLMSFVSRNITTLEHLEEHLKCSQDGSQFDKDHPVQKKFSWSQM
jgi:hypothetical protein